MGCDERQTWASLLWYLTVFESRLNRREFMKKAAGCAVLGTLCSVASQRGFAMALEKMGRNGIESLLKAVNNSNPGKASETYQKILAEGGDPGEVHRSLYPVAQRVLNPPYINPHLPKMYAIHRELVRYLNAEDVPVLVRLELTEYARRPKLEKPPSAGPPKSRVVFRDVQMAIRDGDSETTAMLMAGFHKQNGGRELARRLLLLGGGYLNNSLGHSLSCTAFILREMLERRGEDPWPVIFTLADYFCKGGFHTSLAPDAAAAAMESGPERTMVRATSGHGIVNLHHTITFYALDRVRFLFTTEEHRALFGAAIRFMGDKKGERMAPQLPRRDAPHDYSGFFRDFSGANMEPVIASVSQMISSEDKRRELGRYLIKGVCDLYQGDYDPHFITGLGSMLWVLETYPTEETVCLNALHQYLDYYFDNR
jgi:hypothetical protein